MMLTRPLACAGLRPRARSARRWTSLEQLWCSAPEFQICKSFSSCATPTPRPPVVNAMAPAYKGPSVAVVGAGVAGCVCASTLAERGIPVTLFEMGRGPGGRMSQRRETTSDGKELFFDHGAQYFTVKFPAVQKLVDRWLASGLVKEWSGKFGSFDRVKMSFQDETFEDDSPKYVGVPGMNSICKAMSKQPGVTTAYGTTVGSLTWKEGNALGVWHLGSKNGDNLGSYAAVVAADKSLASERFTALTGLPPPLEKAGVPDIYAKMTKLKSVSVLTVMVAFAEGLASVPFDRFTIERSNLLAGAVRVSSKPGREVVENSEYWVLHSTIEYAKQIIEEEGYSKPSSESLNKIADTLFQEFKEIVPEAPTPFFMKAHRWGSAFPAQVAAQEEKCLVDPSRRIAACGDYCVGPRIECAILSGLAAADNIQRLLEVSGSKI
ncbi:renalase [Marchantia polymorpha subsp. ruderalis]